MAIGGTGTFGATNNTSSGSSLFGAPKPATGFGAFSAGTGAFGGGTAGTGTFGSTPAAGATAGSSLFGGAPNTSTAGGNTFGSSSLFGGPKPIDLSNAGDRGRLDIDLEEGEEY